MRTTGRRALAPAYLHYDGGPRPGTVVTIHNLAFQGHFPAALLAALGLPPHAMSIDGVEYFGGVGFLKAGLQFADRITTVSPTYAREILTPEFGMALDGLLRARARRCRGHRQRHRRRGLEPGDRPDPAAELFSALRIDSAPPQSTPRCSSALGLDADADAPLFGVVSRLTSQKGLDLLLAALPDLVARRRRSSRCSAPARRDLEQGFAAAAAAITARGRLRFRL